MKLFYWEGINGIKNFGDELNNLIWPELLPDLFSDPRDLLFIGIGTLLNEQIPVDKSAIIFGTGVGYGALPKPHPGWKIYCLRGPLSAHALNLDNKLSICDPAILISKLFPANLNNPKSFKFGYMPHWLNNSPLLEKACSKLGISYINPTNKVTEVLSKIYNVEYLITEAMHGAIVADSFRIPWMPIADATNPHTLPFKWFDWCYSVKLHYKPIKAPSMFSETSIIDPLSNKKKASVLEESIVIQLDKIVKNQNSILSTPTILDNVCTRLEEKLALLKKDLSTSSDSLAKRI